MKQALFFVAVNLVVVMAGIFLFVGKAELKSVEPIKFIFQLQDVDYEELLKAPFDLAVIDWEEANLSAEHIEGLHKQGKKVVSYLSIGEAEIYRDYWKNSWNSHPPEFLEEENPVWKGNFKVYYWDKIWQDIIFSKLDKIVERGYDGVYLDIIDGYYYFEEKGVLHARASMIDFVREISKRAKDVNKEFYIFPQNSPELVANPRFMEVIDGIGNESTWYDDDRLREKEESDWEVRHLDMVIAAQKMVLGIEYATEQDKKCRFFEKAKQHGYAAFVTNRALDKIGEMDCQHGE